MTYIRSTVLRNMYCYFRFEMLAVIMLVGRDTLESGR